MEINANEEGVHAVVEKPEELKNIKKQVDDLEKEELDLIQDMHENHGKANNLPFNVVYDSYMFFKGLSVDERKKWLEDREGFWKDRNIDKSELHDHTKVNIEDLKGEYVNFRDEKDATAYNLLRTKFKKTHEEAVEYIKNCDNIDLDNLDNLEDE